MNEQNTCLSETVLNFRFFNFDNMKAKVPQCFVVFNTLSFALVENLHFILNPVQLLEQSSAYTSTCKSPIHVGKIS